MSLLCLPSQICSILSRGYDKYIKSPIIKRSLGHCGINVNLRHNKWRTRWKNVFLYDDTHLVNFNFISQGGNFVLKKGSGAAEGLTVVTNMHQRVLNSFYRITMDNEKEPQEKDVIVEEDVWIGANVTLLAGVTIGRGANIGAGSVVRNNVPPYSIVIGNPAKVIGFCFTPEEILKHEQSLYTTKVCDL